VVLTRVGVVGAGGIAPEHLRVLSARPDVLLVGIADRSPATARWAAEQWDAQGWVTDHTALLAQGIDVLHVLTPPESHAAIARDALEAGAHVLVEKPLVPTRTELTALHEVAERTGHWLLEDHNYRWNDGVQWLLGLVADGALGEVRDVEVAMALPIRAGGAFADHHLPSPAHRLPAGVLHDFLPHLAYLALLFAPGAQEASRLAAVWSNLGGEDGLWRADDLDALVVHGPVHVRLRFSSHTSPDRFAVTVRGTGGDATVDLFQPYERSRLARPVGAQLTPLVNQASNGLRLVRQTGRNFRDKIAQHTPYHGMHTFLGLVYDALRDGAPPPLSFAEIDACALLVDRLAAELP
jgi:predicted dehydrogenase